MYPRSVGFYPAFQGLMRGDDQRVSGGYHQESKGKDDWERAASKWYIRKAADAQKVRIAPLFALSASASGKLSLSYPLLTSTLPLPNMFWSKLIALLTITSSFVLAQHTGPVGPLTSLTSKATICNVLNYGAKPDNNTDIGPAILAAFSQCVIKTAGSRLVVPEGNWALKSSVTLKNGKNFAFQL